MKDRIGTTPLNEEQQKVINSILELLKGHTVESAERIIDEL